MNVKITIEYNTAFDVKITIEYNTASDVKITIEYNTAFDVEITIEYNTAFDIKITREYVQITIEYNTIPFSKSSNTVQYFFNHTEFRIHLMNPGIFIHETTFLTLQHKS